MWDRLTDHDFAFVATEAFSKEREQMGWSAETTVPFLVEYNALDSDGIADMVDNCETLILGNAPLEMVQNRLNNKKLVLKYSERVFKSGYQPWKWLPRLYRFWQRYGRYKSLFLLSASAYTTVDFAMHGAFIGKSYRWGYFPPTKHYENVDAFLSKKEPTKILWCGRFLTWKHPEYAIEIARRLKAEGYSFTLEMIGMGEMEDALERMIYDHDVSDCVRLLGTMRSDAVRGYMERAGIYLFTSDFREGWGAVLNESMNSGCAIVASHAIGSVPFLMKHRENGLIYQNGNVDDLYTKVKFLLDHPDEQRVLGKKAYHTIVDLWNAEVAAKRLLNLIRELQHNGTCDLYQEGPCSKASLIRNNWFKE